jgi:hypothetical protein
MLVVIVKVSFLRSLPDEDKFTSFLGKHQHGQTLIAESA